jgi:acyl-CoA thioesterase I
MLRKMLIGLGLFVLALVISELIGLLILRHNVGAYARYWQQQSEQPGDFTYVVLGDSIAQAIGASRPQDGYVGLVARQIEQRTGKRVRIINLSVTGAKISDLLQKQLPELSKYSPDLVTVEIGANDMRSYNSATFRAQYEQFITALPAGRSVISTMPYFGTRPGVNPHALDANRTIAKLAATYNVPMVDIYGALRAQQSPFIYAADFFHPSNRGYHVWYDAFWPAVAKIKRL